MNMKPYNEISKWITVLLLVLPWSAVAGSENASAKAGPVAPPATAKPNILFIVADDLGFADVGFQGCKDIPTPNIDALAASGVRFRNGYVSCPVCSPSRAGLMTGRYQNRFGHEFNPVGYKALPLAEKTLADRLKAAGYVTGLVGKWHLGGGVPELYPTSRGFDEFFGFLAQAHDYFRAAGIVRGREPVASMDYTTDAFGREAVDFIERHKQQSWFLYLAFNAVHCPLQATPERLAKFSQIANPRRRAYAAVALALDEAIGTVMKKLAETGQDRNTLVFFISDNGGALIQLPGCNAPLRGGKTQMLEGGIRVPFVLAWPGHLKPGVEERPVIHLDAHATALALAGVEPERPIDGVNLIPYLTGQNSGSPHEALYWRYGEQMAIRVGDYKLVRYNKRENEDQVTAVQLYNLSDDIGESRDLAAAMPEKVRELQARWDAWNGTLVPPLWTKGPKKEARVENGPGPKH